MQAALNWGIATQNFRLRAAQKPASAAAVYAENGNAPVMNTITNNVDRRVVQQLTPAALLQLMQDAADGAAIYDILENSDE